MPVHALGAAIGMPPPRNAAAAGPRGTESASTGGMGTGVDGRVGGGVGKPLRIAQIAPLYESVPPKLYGGTERVVSYLTDELVGLGHDVTLFASGDSISRARLVPGPPRALRLDPSCMDPLAHHVVLLEKVQQRAEEFDVLHFHIDYLHFPVSRRGRSAHVSTLHGRLDLPDLAIVYDEFRETPVVSISEAQREPLPQANWQATVHHGLPPGLHAPGPGHGGYLAFLGRISPEKRVDRAIEIARRAGRRLRIAAKVDRIDAAYFDGHIRPLLAAPHVEFVGEIAEADKGAFLGNAEALLFPIDWPEPFGLVMIEALACGTPVIAFREGSAPEIVEHGRNGFLVDSVGEAAAAVGRLGSLDRGACRRSFEERFTARRMALDYVEVYERLIAARTSGRWAGGSAA
jgi:glycosyltransferase involved in cell wall biosynthesis